MADPIEFEIKADVDDAIKALEKVRDKLEGVGDETKETEKATSSMAGKITAATVSFQAISAAIQKTIDVIVEVTREFERTAGVLNRFSGDISDASNRVNALITDMDLMIAQNQLAAAGFELTAEEFGNLAVAAGDFAANQGTDATEAFVGLTNAIITGGEELIRFDINLSETKDVTDKQAAAIAQLGERYQGTSVSADTLAGEVLVLGNRLDNATTEMVDAITNSAALERELDNLRETLAVLGVAFDGPLSDMDNFNAAVTALLTNLARKIGAVAEAFNQLGSLDFDGAVSALENGFTRSLSQDFLEARGEIQRRNAERDLERARNAPTGDLRGRLAGNTAQAPGAADTSLETAIETGVDDALTEALGLANEQIITRENAHKDHLARLAEAQREHAAEMKQIAADVQAKEGEAAKQRAQFEQDKIDAVAASRAADIQKVEAGVQTSMQAGTMLLEHFGATQGQMELFQGIADAAMAITKFAAYDYGSGALYLLSSGLHFANAAQMGVGGGSNASAASAGGGQGRQARPVAPAGGGGGGGPGNFTVNINSPMTERDIGRTQRRAEQERMRRFDPSV